MPVDYLSLAKKQLDAVTPSLCEIQWENEGVIQHLYLCDDTNSIWWDGTNGATPTVGVGNEYIPANITIKLPNIDDATGAKLELRNTDLGIVRLLRTLDVSPRFITYATLIDNPHGTPIINKIIGANLILTNICVTDNLISANLNTGLQIDFNIPREVGNQKIIPGA